MYTTLQHIIGVVYKQSCPLVVKYPMGLKIKVKKKINKKFKAPLFFPFIM